jgi:hypothetical protein
VAYYLPREGSKHKKEWLTFRPRIRLGMCIKKNLTSRITLEVSFVDKTSGTKKITDNLTNYRFTQQTPWFSFDFWVIPSVAIPTGLDCFGDRALW